MPDTKYDYCIDTDSYAGNFEREMCAYITGNVGECEVGVEQAVLFTAELGYDLMDEFYGVIAQVMDEHGCARPVCATATPGTSYDTQHAGKTHTHLKCNTVSIYFHKMPTQEMLAIMSKRAEVFAKERPECYSKDVIKIIGVRMLKKETTVTSEELTLK